MLNKNAALVEPFVISAIRSGQPVFLRISETYFSIKINQEKTTYFDLSQDSKALPLLSKVRSDAKYYLEKKQTQKQTTQSIDYFGFRNENVEKVLGKETAGYKIDISGAYWNVARKKFLSGATYELGAKNKPARLMALGSLAKRTLEMEYLEGSCTREEIVRPETFSLYVEICDEIDRLLQELAQDVTTSLGYWVDCIILKGTATKEVRRLVELFAAHGHRVTVEKTKLLAKKDGENIYIEAKTEAETKTYFTGLRVA